VFARGKVEFQERGLLRVVPTDQDFHGEPQSRRF
jgi:hypothetical protein